jgi:phosphoribosyl 1,2-cyclic phosphodiesterase
MIIRFWGVRGSIPVSGREHLKYGGDTTCVEIRTKDDEILIVDAGSGIRKLGNRLMEEGRREFNLIFTHTHLDHITGLPFFKPLYYKKTKINMHSCPSHQGDILQVLSNVITPPYFPMPLNDIMVNLSYATDICNGFSIGGMRVETIPLNHPNMGIGFKFTEGGKSFVFLTDNELAYSHPGGPDYKSFVDFSAGADLLVHDGEYTSDDYTTMKGWGHSLYKDALKLALEADVKSLGLCHHNQNRTDDEIDSIVNKCSDIIKDAGSGLECFAVAQDLEIEL